MPDHVEIMVTTKFVSDYASASFVIDRLRLSLFLAGHCPAGTATLYMRRARQEKHS